MYHNFYYFGGVTNKHDATGGKTFSWILEHDKYRQIHVPI